MADSFIPTHRISLFPGGINSVESIHEMRGYVQCAERVARDVERKSLTVRNFTSNCSKLAECGTCNVFQVFGPIFTGYRKSCWKGSYGNAPERRLAEDRKW